MFDTSNKMETQKVGPDLQRGQNDTLSDVAETVASLNQAGPQVSASVKSGINQFANLGIYNSAPRLYLTALADRSA
jgi:hypothetical protein